ncbi:MAG: ABC transporter permease [Thermoplasmatales archaeon]
MKLYIYIIRRLLLLIPVIVGVTLITFYLSHVNIGMLISTYEGTVRTAARREEVITSLHLNGPLYIQYFYYFTNLFTGKWGFLSPGEPFDAGVPVFVEFQRRFPPTAELAIFATVLVLLMGIPLGVLSAVKKDRLVDQITRLIAMTAVSIPVFWFGLIIIIALGPTSPIPLPLRITGEGQLNWAKYAFTSSGALQPWVFSMEGGLSRPTGFLLIDTLYYHDLPAFLDGLKHLFWPAFTVAVTSFGVIIRFLRSSMLETMSQDYVRTARSKGVPESFVIKKHARRNALGTTTTVMGLFFAGLLSGVVVTENVFGWPGMGTWLFDAAESTDLGSVIATTFVFTIVIVVANLMVDIIYSYLDPRVRLD